MSKIEIQVMKFPFVISKWEDSASKKNYAKESALSKDAGEGNSNARSDSHISGVSEGEGDDGYSPQMA